LHYPAPEPDRKKWPDIRPTGTGYPVHPYLGDMFSVDGDADAAVEARIRIGWNKFRQLVPLLSHRE